MVTTASTVVSTIDYTSRDYLSLRTDMIRLIRTRLPQWSADNDADFGVALVEAYAYAADTLHYYLDRVANEAYLQTAVQRESLYAIAEMFNYTPRAASAAQVNLLFSNSTSSEITLPINTRCQATIITSSGSIIRNFETNVETIVPPIRGVIPGEILVGAIEGRTYTDESIGVSNGFIRQQYMLPRTSVLPFSVKISTQAGESNVEWFETAELSTASPGDYVFQILRQTDGSSLVRFGNGLQGMIPPLHSIIRASYRVGGGIEGNVAQGSINTLVEPVLYGVSVINESAALGGQNVESIDSIRVNAARSFRARDRAVTLADYEAVASTAPGIAKAKAIGNNGSSVTVYVCPVDDGTHMPELSNDMKRSTETYLEQRAMAGVTVTVLNPEWLQVYMKITAYCFPTASQGRVARLIRGRLVEFFGFNNVDFDGRVAASDITSALRDIDGLDYVEVNDLSLSPAIMAPGYAGTPSNATILLNRHATGAIQYFSEVMNLRITMVGGIGAEGAV